MYGYSTYTIVYWAIESIGAGLIAVLLGLGLWKKWRFTAFAYPVGQLLIRASVLVFQPTDYGYEITLEKAALLLALGIFSGLMYRYSGFGYITALGSVWMLLITLPEGLADIGTFFLFGGELIFLGLQIIFSAIQYMLLCVLGLWFGKNKIRPFGENRLPVNHQYR